MEKKNSLTQQYFFHQFCSLEVTHRLRNTEILMKLLSPHVRTGEFPQTLSILREIVPTVLQTRCHNDLHLPFKKEVIDTEFGHLFEHLIIDYLSRDHLKFSRPRSCYRGVTEWNWKLDPRGTFHITISAGKKERKRMYDAIAVSYSIIEKIFQSPCSASQVETVSPFIHTETVSAVSV
jgi:hypothetical protein